MNVREFPIDVATPTGPMRTHVFQPYEATRPERRDPGILMYSEIFQLTPPVRRIATQFASRGYLVFTPEIYHAHEVAGTVLGYDDAGKNRGNDLKLATPLSDVDADIGAAAEALSTHAACNGRIGAAGICIGGHFAFRAALHPLVRAAACFYATDLHTGGFGKGGNADSLGRASEIKGELLMIFGRQDPHVPVDGRRRIHEALEAAGVWYTWHEFNAAHAFLRDEGERYDPAAAHLCMELAGDLFRRNL